MAASHFKTYVYRGANYTLDTHNWMMTVYDEEIADVVVVIDPQVVAQVITLGAEGLVRK